jgi:hypothetical protein
MKTLLIFMVLGLLTAGCSCNNEDDDFTPYPGGKSPKETPKS